MRVFRLRTACRPPFSFRSPDGHEDQSARRFGRTVARAFDPPSGHGSRRWAAWPRSEEHTSELQSLMRISYAVFCLKKKNLSSFRHYIIFNNITISFFLFFLFHTS